jgi:hypothetical protein
MNPQSGHREGYSRAARRRLWILACCVALVLAACDGGSSAGSTTTSSDSPASTASTNPPTSTSTSSTTTTQAPTTTTVDPTGEVSQAWEDFWEAWAAVRASEDLDAAPLAQVADPTVVEAEVSLFERQRELGSGPISTEVVTHTKVTELGPGEAVVEDCVLLTPSWTEHVGVWYEADLKQTDSGWIVSDLRVPSLGGCVPEDMVSDAIASYEAYYDAVDMFWDPPDPNHPLLRDVLAEPRLSNVIELLEEHAARGVAFRTSPITHPEVIEVRSPTELVILDCYEPDQSDGVYDLTTGERLSDEPPVREGQRNLRSAVMVFEDGKWKSSDFQGQVDFECEFAPTERGLPSI